VLGLHHEQQHQELILTDVKHLLSLNPLGPVHRPDVAPAAAAHPLRWHRFDEAIRQIGVGESGFAFDNERPRHRALVHAFELASRLVTVEEYAAFIADRGYERAELWLSDGWATLHHDGWRAPLYWRDDLPSSAPVCHVSYYEADAYARWAGARLPTEFEWEAASGHDGFEQLFGDCWQWTSSAYSAYPGYRPLEGALGEYNGKFMCNQLVLRGSSCATPQGHTRATYRNFFPPAVRWQFSGIRLAKDT
jgi:ergothioneine biosynthesis protein EgtB